MKNHMALISSPLILAKFSELGPSVMHQRSQFTGCNFFSPFFWHLLQLAVDIPYHCMIKKKPESPDNNLEFIN